MANTYTQIHLQFVIAVRNRNALIHNSWKEDLFRYITGIVQSKGHKMLAINGMPDHIHLLVGLRPTQSASGLMQDVKSGSSKWINDSRLSAFRFEWQEGYGAFSYSLSELPNVINYIQAQEEHHKKRTFMDEYVGFLEEFNIDYKSQYLFHEPQ